MTLRWAYVDFGARCLRLPDTKTGARVVHLGGPALEVLSSIQRRPDNSWVICGKNPGARRTDLQPPWQRMRKRATVRLWARSAGTPEAALVSRLEARLGREPTHDECLAAARKRKLDLPTGLVDVRIHDLRHSFASGAVALGESLPMIGKLLATRRCRPPRATPTSLPTPSRRRRNASRAVSRLSSAARREKSSRLCPEPANARSGGVPSSAGVSSGQLHHLPPVLMRAVALGMLLLPARTKLGGPLSGAIFLYMVGYPVTSCCSAETPGPVDCELLRVGEASDPCSSLPEKEHRAASGTRASVMS